MQYLKASLIAAALALAVPVAVNADPGKGNGKGQFKHEKKWEGGERRADRAYRQGFRDGVHAERTWRRGQVLPYEHRRAVIYDPYRYGLYAPPRGHAWVQVDNDVYLTQIATGLIAEVLRDSL